MGAHSLTLQVKVYPKSRLNDAIKQLSETIKKATNALKSFISNLKKLFKQQCIYNIT